MYIASMALVGFPFSSRHKILGCAFWRLSLRLAKVVAFSYIREMWSLTIAGNVFFGVATRRDGTSSRVFY